MPHATIAARPIWSPTAEAPAMRKASWRRISAKVAAGARNMVMMNVIQLTIALCAAIASMAISSGLFTKIWMLLSAITVRMETLMNFFHTFAHTAEWHME
jgi:hypothetical protein